MKKPFFKLYKEEADEDNKKVIKDLADYLKIQMKFKSDDDDEPHGASP